MVISNHFLKMPEVNFKNARAQLQMYSTNTIHFQDSTTPTLQQNKSYRNIYK